MPTIVLADDHQVVRQGLRYVLEAEPGFQLIGEAGDGLAALQAVEKLHPDVLVLDLMMPGLNGLDVARQINQRHPGTRVVILSMHANPAYVVEAFRNGAAGYVLKDGSAEDLVKAIRSAHAGERFLSAALSQRDLDIYSEGMEESVLDEYETLTSREREVLHLIAEGHSSTQVAQRLSISPRTAEVHRANLMKKLKLRSQNDITRFAIRRGLVQLDT